MAALPLVAVGLLLAPQSVTDRARVWAAPALRPLEHLAAGWALDMSGAQGDPYGRGIGAARSGSADAPALARRLDRLEDALAEATARLAEYDRRVRDLAGLREALDGLPCRLIPARVIGPSVAGGRAPALLSKGSADGVGSGGAVVQARLNRGAREAIARGEPVLTAAGLVGLVEQVGPLTSTVRLVTDPQTSLMVQLVTRRDGRWRPGPVGLARGTGDGRTLAVEHVSRGADVAPGDVVVTSPSAEAALPPYLVLGRVVRARLEPTSLFYSLVVEPRAPPAAAREVYVLSRETDAGR